MLWSKHQFKKPVENIFLLFALFLLFVFLYHQTALANPYGFDTYGIGQYGTETMLTISTNGNVSIPATSGAVTTNVLSPAVITVTTTDKNGYNLYIRSLNGTALTDGSKTIPPSSNVTQLSLANNTWGYNTNGSATTFIGITSSDVIIRTASLGPYYPTGSNTSVVFGLNIDNATAAGNYSGQVVFTAVAQSP